MSLVFKNKTILVAEDDVVSNENVCYMLRRYFKDVFSAYTGEEAYSMYIEHKPDVILSDIEMPVMDGLKLIEKIRTQDDDTAIIVMTSFTYQHYLLQAFNLQLLSYLVKPLHKESFQQMFEKLESYFLSQPVRPFYFTDKIYYDNNMKAIVDDTKIVALTHQEISLLEEFIKNKNRTLTNDFIEEKLGLKSSKNANAVKLTISRLRKKLPSDVITTIYAEGYVLAHEHKH